MAQHDFLGMVLPQAQTQPVLAVDQVPDAPAILDRGTAYEKELEQLDLVELTEAELKGVGPPATAEEMELNDAYADLTEQVSEILDLLKKPRTLMRDAVRLDQSLLQLQGANRQLGETTGVLGLLLAADLTARTDRVENVLAHEVAEGLSTADEHRRNITLFGGVYQVRGDLVRSQHERDLRGKRRSTRLRDQLQAEDHKNEVVLKMEELATAPLPPAETTRRKS